MAILNELIKMDQLINSLSKKYGETVIDKESGKSLSWMESFHREIYGMNWETHPEYLRTLETFGGIDERYFEVAEHLLVKKSDWMR